MELKLNNYISYTPYTFKIVCYTIFKRHRVCTCERNARMVNGVILMSQRSFPIIDQLNILMNTKLTKMY